MRFRTVLAFLLNVPYTTAGILLSLLYIPYKLRWEGQKSAVLVYVKYDRFALLPYMKGWRAMALGHTVIMGPREVQNDLAHELVHVEQAIRYPFVFPFMYYAELFLRGYRNNKFEREAYDRAGNVYRSHESKNDPIKV